MTVVFWSFFGTIKRQILKVSGGFAPWTRPGEGLTSSSFRSPAVLSYDLRPLLIVQICYCKLHKTLSKILQPAQKFWQTTAPCFLEKPARVQTIRGLLLRGVIIKTLCLMIRVQKPAKILSSDDFDTIPKINTEGQLYRNLPLIYSTNIQELAWNYKCIFSSFVQQITNCNFLYGLFSITS